MTINGRAIVVLTIAALLATTGCAATRAETGDTRTSESTAEGVREETADPVDAAEEDSPESPLDWINYGVLYGTPYPDGFVMVRAFSTNGFVCGGSSYQPTYFSDASDPRTLLDPSGFSSSWLGKHDLSTGKYCFSIPADDGTYPPSVISADGLVITGENRVEYQLIDSGDGWIDVLRTDEVNGSIETERWTEIPGTATGQ